MLVITTTVWKSERFIAVIMAKLVEDDFFLFSSEKQGLI